MQTSIELKSGKKEKVAATTGAPAIGPYSPGIRVGQFFFLSGQIPLNERGDIVGTTAAEQTRQVLKNIQALLETQGFDFNNVVKTTIFLKSMGDFASVNEAYAGSFVDPYPARSTIEVARLPKDVLVEIEVIAVS